MGAQPYSKAKAKLGMRILVGLYSPDPLLLRYWYATEGVIEVCECKPRREHGEGGWCLLIYPYLEAGLERRALDRTEKGAAQPRGNVSVRVRLGGRSVRYVPGLFRKARMVCGIRIVAPVKEVWVLCQKCASCRVIATC